MLRMGTCSSPRMRLHADKLLLLGLALKALTPLADPRLLHRNTTFSHISFGLE